jgi:membrane-bound serine protease (ClpP class)
MNDLRQKMNLIRIRRSWWCILAACLVISAWPPVSSASSATPNTSEPSAASEAGSNGAIISIHTEITDVTAESVKRRIHEAKASGATTIVLDLNTPGGLVTSTFDIADAIRNLTGIRTVAWVNNTAHSGGALVAIACDEIVTTRSSRIGDAQVIFGNPVGAEPVPEDLKAKITTPVLADVRASAQLRGYSQVLCEALVEPDLEVWWLENTETGEREFVFREEKIERLGEEKSKPKVEKPKPKKAESETDSDSSATAEDVIEEDKSSEDTIVPADAPANRSKWKLVETYYDIVLERDVPAIQPVVRDDQLLQMSAAEAYAYGFSKGLAADDSALKARYSLVTLTRLSPFWSETLALWLTSMWVRGFLLMIIMLGAYVEFHTPGVGVPGLAALICLAIFVGAPYVTGLANIWEIIFILAGLLLIGLEVFVLPGFGIAGISGIVLLLIGLLATFVPDEPGRSVPFYVPSLPSTLEYLKHGLVTVVLSITASLAGMVMLSRVLPKTLMFRRIVPANPTPSEVAMDDPYRGLARIGDLGATVGPLHPAGKARFSGELVDVVTQGEFVDSGMRVEVIERRGNRVVVRAFQT